MTEMGSEGEMKGERRRGQNEECGRERERATERGREGCDMQRERLGTMRQIGLS